MTHAIAPFEINLRTYYSVVSFLMSKLTAVSAKEIPSNNNLFFLEINNIVSNKIPSYTN